MGLFSRRSSKPATDETATDETAADGAAGSEAPEEAGRGPWDLADAPESKRIDLGALQVPVREDLQVRLEADRKTQQVTGVDLVYRKSSLRLQAFAAPKRAGLWDEVRPQLRETVTRSGGTAEQRDGAFGRELSVRIPTTTQDGRKGFRPARFLGIDGPRWFLRGVVSGRALVEPEIAEAIDELMADVVVVRGPEPRVPQELLPLHQPGKKPGAEGETKPDLEPLGRGPEITEVG